MNRIVIGDDDAEHRKGLSQYFTGAGHAVVGTGTRNVAGHLVAERRPDLLVVAWPAEAVVKYIRNNAGTRTLPVLAVGADDGDAACIEALDTGVDDYVARPYSPALLLARTRALLRRRNGHEAPGDWLRWADISMEPTTGRVFRGEREIRLSPTERAMLRFLLDHGGEVVSQEALREAVWGTRDVRPRMVYIYIRRLRRALDMAGRASAIRTVRGFGYALDDKADTVAASGATRGTPSPAAGPGMAAAASPTA